MASFTKTEIVMGTRTDKYAQNYRAGTTRLINEIKDRYTPQIKAAARGEGCSMAIQLDKIQAEIDAAATPEALRLADALYSDYLKIMMTQIQGLVTALEKAQKKEIEGILEIQNKLLDDREALLKAHMHDQL